MNKEISYHHVLWCFLPLWYPCKRGTVWQQLIDHLIKQFLIFYVHHLNFHISFYRLFCLICLVLWYNLNIWSSKLLLRKYLFTKLDNFFKIELISNASDGCDTFSSSGLDFRDMDEVLIEVIELLSTLKIVKVRHMLKSSLINIIFFSYSSFSI